MSAQGTFLRSGKVKDIYELDSQHLLFHFTDRVSAFDVVLPTKVPRKGEVLCKLGAHFFETLGVPNHMVRLDGADSMVVKKMKMILVECVVRGYLYGSLMERLNNGQTTIQVPPILASKLPDPYFDPTTKSEVKDEPITESEIVVEGRATREELEELRVKSFEVYKKIGLSGEKAGFILADIKLEFGKDPSGRVLLGDSIGPDEFRMWPAKSYSPGKSQESYDKQPISDWLTSVGYKAELDKARKSGASIPAPPALPGWLVEETVGRYTTVYEGLTGKKL